MSEYDGPTLRSVRESVGVPLRRVARLASMSHGHLSKVERGEHGRPVTPAILAAYEKATGVRLTEARIVGPGEGGSSSWRRGRLSDARRRAFNATVAAVAVGGPVGEPVSRLIDAIGRMVTPDQVETGDVSQIERAAQLLTSEDLRWGGGTVNQLARVVLRWSVGLTSGSMTTETHARLHAAIGQLAARAGWAAFDADAHDAARSLFTVALDAAIQSRDRNLRAHVLADVGAQHNHLGYPDDCLEIVSMVEGDQRIGPAVRTALYGVKARAHAAAGDVSECRRHIALAEESHGKAVGERSGSWWDSLCTDAYLNATTGHAAATLMRQTGSGVDLADAVQRLRRAVDGFDPDTHARARALCASRLALLHLDAGDLDAGIPLARQALDTAVEIRSARLVRQVREVHAVANARPDDPSMRELASRIDEGLASSTPDEPNPADAAPEQQSAD